MRGEGERFEKEIGELGAKIELTGGEDKEIIVEGWVEIEDQLRQVKVNVATNLKVHRDRVGAVKGDVAYRQMSR